MWGDEFKKCLPRLRAWLDEYGKTLISPKKEWFLSKHKTICYGIEKNGLLMGCFGFRIAPEKGAVNVGSWGAKTGCF